MAKVWSQVIGSKKWHLFRVFGLLSLCRRYSIQEADGDEEEAKQLTAKPYDCKACVKEYNRIKTEAYR
jgi:hypothetical protein